MKLNKISSKKDSSISDHIGSHLSKSDSSTADLKDKKC